MRIFRKFKGPLFPSVIPPIPAPAPQYEAVSFQGDFNRRVTTVRVEGNGMPPWVVEFDDYLLAELRLGEKELTGMALKVANAGHPPIWLQNRLVDTLLDRQRVLVQQASAAALQQQAALQNHLMQQGVSPPPGLGSYGQGAPYGQQQLNQMQQAQNQFSNQMMNGYGYGQFNPPAPEIPPRWENPERVEEEIIAYRCWYLDWELVGWTEREDLPILRPILHSTNRPFAWDGPVVRADVPPARNTKSGIYAVGVEDRFSKNFGYVQEGNVWGEVALSGLVVEGEAGYRAEVCTIRRLWLGGKSRINVYLPRDQVTRLLAERYQCDVGREPLQPAMETAQDLYRHRTP